VRPHPRIDGAPRSKRFDPTAPLRATVRSKHVDGELMFVCGKKRSGKTTLAVRSLIADLRAGCPALVLDPQGDVHKRLLGNSKTGIRIPAKWCAKVTKASQVQDLWKRRWWEVIWTYEPPRVFLFDTDALDEFLLAANAKWSRGWCVFVDEAEELFPNARMKDAPRRLQQTCGNRGVRLYVVCQAPQSIATPVRRNADWICTFRFDSWAIVQSLARECGTDEELWDEARTLPRDHYLCRGPWLDDPEAALPVYNSLTDPIQWKPKAGIRR